MIHQHLPSDPRIVDEVFNVVAKPGLEDVGWLLGMVAVYGKSPEELKGFTWNEGQFNQHSIEENVLFARCIHSGFFIFQLKEKQPFTRKSRWNPLVARLDKAVDEEKINLSVDGLLLAHKVRKVYYTPLKPQKRFESLALA